MIIIWDFPLLFLSIATAIIGSITALTHSQRMRSSTGHAKTIWMIAGGLTLGLAIWSMHFVGMSAFHLSIPIGYDLTLTLLSIIPGIAAAFLCFYVLSQSDISTQRLLISSLLMGVGISAMHYTGMAAIKMTPPIRYETVFVVFSIVISVIASLAAMLMMYKGNAIKMPALLRLVLGGIIMGVAISGMHYISMLGMIITPNSICTTASTGIGQYTPVKMVFVITLIIFMGGILAASYDQRLTDRTLTTLDELKKAHAVLQEKSEQIIEQEKLLRSLTDAANDAIILLDPKGLINYWNSAAENMFGYHRSEIIGENLHDILVPKRNLGEHKIGFEKFVVTGKGRFIGKTRRIEAINRKGEEFPVDISLSSLQLQDEWFAIGLVRDATEQVRAEELIKNKSEHLEEAQKLAHIGSWDLDISSNKLIWSDEIYRLFEVDNKQFEATYEGFINAIHPDDREMVNKAFVESVSKKQPYNIIHRLQMPDGRIKWVHERGQTKYDKNGNSVQSSGTVQDITERKLAEEEIEKLAFYDPLTKLPNRRLLHDRFEQALLASERSKKHGAVLFLDLDRFKLLNDTKGHDVGDLLLIEVANRLVSSVRKTDTVARMGGDEFIIILEELSENADEALEQIETTSENIRDAIDSPYLLNGYQHHSSTSIGVCIFIGMGVASETLILRADKAMYKAKSVGRNTVYVDNKF